MAPSPYIFIFSIGPVDMNKYARFDEIPSKTLKDSKETKRHRRTENVKTVYPPTNTVCRGYNKYCLNLLGHDQPVIYLHTSFLTDSLQVLKDHSFMIN